MSKRLISLFIALEYLLWTTQHRLKLPTWPLQGTFSISTCIDSRGKVSNYNWNWGSRLFFFLILFIHLFFTTKCIPTFFFITFIGSQKLIEYIKHVWCNVYEIQAYTKYLLFAFVIQALHILTVHLLFARSRRIIHIEL